MKLQPQRLSGNEFNMEPSFHNNNNTHRSGAGPLDEEASSSSSSTSSPTTTTTTDAETMAHSEDERLQYISNQLKMKQVPPTSHHGLTILITGANSGIGLAAVKLLIMNNPLHRIIVACRTQAKADETRQSLLHLLPTIDNDTIKYHENIIALECDHTSFRSIREFDERLRIKLNETYTPNKWIYNGIDVLCCNAAILVPKNSLPQFTDDGYEVTFQTNYLSPFLLVQCVLDLMNPGGRIVMTTSGLFDHVQIHNLNGIIDSTNNNNTNMVRKYFPMIDDSTEFHYKTSYSISKLCIVGLCAELVERISPRRNLVINCFSPGLMTTSGLFRHQPFPNDCNNNSSTTQQKLPKAQHEHYTVDILLKEKTVEWGAGAMVYMILGQETGIRNAEYWSDTHSTLGLRSQYGVHFTPMDITHRVSAPIRKELWQLSCQLVGLKPSVVVSSTSHHHNNGESNINHDPA